MLVFGTFRALRCGGVEVLLLLLLLLRCGCILLLLLLLLLLDVGLVASVWPCQAMHHPLALLYLTSPRLALLWFVCVLVGRFGEWVWF